MDIAIVTWKITGIKPLIQSNPHGMWLPPEEDDGKPKTTRRKTLRGSNSEDFIAAEKQLYVNEDGQHYHPAIAFWDNLKAACRGRMLGIKNALTAVTQAVTVIDEEFVLYDPETLDAKKPKPMKGTEWQIDYRRAVNHNKNKSDGGVGVVAIRPKWKTWGGFLSLEVDRDHFKTFDGLTDLLNIGGHHFGAGVGRIRVKATVKQQEVWSGFGGGKYSAELRE